MKSIDFEMFLLDCMPLEYRTVVLKAADISDSEIKSVRTANPIQVSDLSSFNIDKYIEIFGKQKAHEKIIKKKPAQNKEFIAHYFSLNLWPHLYWVVFEQGDGICSETRFENQSAIKFDPSLVRVGIWTRQSLDEMADEVVIYDGWDEDITLRYKFGMAKYEGRFIFGLLVEWHKI